MSGYTSRPGLKNGNPAMNVAPNGDPVSTSITDGSSARTPRTIARELA